MVVENTYVKGNVYVCGVVCLRLSSINNATNAGFRRNASEVIVEGSDIVGGITTIIEQGFIFILFLFFIFYFLFFIFYFFHLFYF